MFVRVGLILWLLWNSLFRFILGSKIPIPSFSDIASKVNGGIVSYAGQYNDNLDMDNAISNLYSVPLPEAPHEPPVSDMNDSDIKVSGINTLMAPLVFERWELNDRKNIRLRAKFNEILEFLFPDSGDSLGFYYIHNWPEDITSRKSCWNNYELEEINRRIPLMKFFSRRRTYLLDKEFGFSTMKCLIHAELDSSMTYISVIQLVFDKFRVECGCPHVTTIDWNLLDRRDIPQKYNGVTLNLETIQSALIHCNREIIDNIHFYSNSAAGINGSSDNLFVPTSIQENPAQEKTDILKLPGKWHIEDCLKQKQLRNELQDLFKQQHPDRVYKLSKYVIMNWPGEVDPQKQRWTKHEMGLIKSNMQNLKFISMSAFNPDWTYELISEFLLQIFRDETGDHFAESIEWSLLDKSSIPPQLCDLVIDDSTMSEPLYYQNAQIVFNIRFIRPIEKKRKFAENDNE